MTLSTAASIFFSLLALAFSGVSVAISTRQASLQNKANNASGVVAILTGFREAQLHESFDQMFEGLPARDPQGGLSGLPSDLRYHTYNVCYFLNEVAGMLVLGIVREDAFLALFRARAIAVWQLVEPFVRRERETNHSVGPEFMSVIEALAARSAATRPDAGRRILAKWLASPVRTS